MSLNFSLQSLFKKEKLLLCGLDAVGISSYILREAFIRAFQEVQPLLIAIASSSYVITAVLFKFIVPVGQKFQILSPTSQVNSVKW